jgi:hypothetical protein
MHSRSPPGSVPTPERGSLAALMTVFCVIGCGGAEHQKIPPVAEAEAGTQVASGVNVCPRFEGSLILPQRIRPGETAVVAVRVSDPDAADSQLVFAWTATSGTFSASDSSVTNYDCSEIGSEQLTFSAVDRQGCSSSLTIAVECIAN